MIPHAVPSHMLGIAHASSAGQMDVYGILSGSTAVVCRARRPFTRAGRVAGLACRLGDKTPDGVCIHVRTVCRAIARGALEALAFCHDKEVVHGSLGPGSILLSTLDDREATQLTVKLDNFGFARRLHTPVSNRPDGQSFPAGT